MPCVTPVTCARLAGSHEGLKNAPQPVRAALEVVPYEHTRQWKELLHAVDDQVSLPVNVEYEPRVHRTQAKAPGRDLA